MWFSNNNKKTCIIIYADVFCMVKISTQHQPIILFWIINVYPWHVLLGTNHWKGDIGVLHVL